MKWDKKMKKSIPKTKGFTFWIHCASLGEFEQGRPVIEMIRTNHPEWFILLTFFSPSGYLRRKEYDKADLVMYLPWDSENNARKFMDILQPDLVCFVKYEFWFHFLKECHRRKITSVLISAIFRKEQVFFKWYGAFYRRILHYFTHLIIQNQESASLLKRINFDNISIAGDNRIDRVIDIIEHSNRFPEIEFFLDKRDAIIVGSAWEDDFEVILPVINDHEIDLKFIVAPHEIKPAIIKKLIQQIDEDAILYSNCLSGEVEGLKNSRILIIDTVGILAQIYQYGTYAYIGGAFGDGLHNILEPAVFGLPIFFGDKYYNKFREANGLLELGGAFTVSQSEDLKNKLLYFSENPERKEKTSSIVKKYIHDNAGATEKVVKFLEKVSLK